MSKQIATTKRFSTLYRRSLHTAVCILALMASAAFPAFSADNPGDKDFEKGEFAMEQGDTDTAIKFLTRATEKGHAKAATLLGILKHKEKKYEEAFNLFKQAAEQGFEPAIMNLAHCYEDGIGCEANQEKAFELFLKLAESGVAEAQTIVGAYYFRGTGVGQDDATAVKWVRKAADQGDLTGQLNLGKCYQWGRGVETNNEEAFKWFKKAAEQGSEAAYYEMGVCYLKGIGTKKDESRARGCFEKAIDYIKKLEDTPEHQYELALAYEGIYRQAGVTITDALLRSDRFINSNLNPLTPEGKKEHERFMEEIGKMTASQKSQYQAAMIKAAENGHPEAQYRLASDSEFGKTPEEKSVWIKKAAEQGHLESMRELGKMSYRPDQWAATPQESAEAKKWYGKAAEQGDIFSQYALACLYERCEKDDVNAFKWYKKTAEHQLEEDRVNNENNNQIIIAQYNLAKRYADGKGVEDNEEEAFKWYKKVAECSLKHLNLSGEESLSSAQYNLGVCYERGWGCTKNIDEAIRWYKAAKETIDKDSFLKNRNKDAEKALQRLGVK